MTTDLPDLTITIPGRLRPGVANAVLQGLVANRDPQRLRLAADLRDPDMADDARYSPAPVEDEHGARPPIALSDDEQAVANGDPYAEVIYTDRDGDQLEVDRWSHASLQGHLRLATRRDSSDDANAVLLSLDHQQRLHALLAANLAKHGAL